LISDKFAFKNRNYPVIGMGNYLLRMTQRFLYLPYYLCGKSLLEEYIRILNKEE